MYVFCTGLHSAFRLIQTSYWLGPNLVLLGLDDPGTVRVLRLGSCGVMIWGMWWEVLPCCSLSESISSTLTAGWMLNLELAAKGTAVTVAHHYEDQTWAMAQRKIMVCLWWFYCYDLCHYAISPVLINLHYLVFIKTSSFFSILCLKSHCKTNDTDLF